MLALRARFDGKKIVLPKRKIKAAPGTVIVIFEETGDAATETRAWMKAQERAFEKAWDNEEDAVYDTM